MTRPLLAAVLALLLIAACRVHVMIWLAGHQVARPPVAGLLLAAIGAAIAVVVFLIWRALHDSVPAPRPAT